MLFKVVVFLLLAGVIFLGARRIWRDWTGQFKAVDKARHERDLKERARPDVIDLKRNKDGVYRPGDGGLMDPIVGEAPFSDQALNQALESLRLRLETQCRKAPV